MVQLGVLRTHSQSTAAEALLLIISHVWIRARKLVIDLVSIATDISSYIVESALLYSDILQSSYGKRLAIMDLESLLDICSISQRHSFSCHAIEHFAIINLGHPIQDTIMHPFVVCPLTESDVVEPIQVNWTWLTINREVVICTD